MKNRKTFSDFNAVDFMDKHNYLLAIHAAPPESWPVLCQHLLAAQDVTVSKISGKAKELAELKKAIPDWWPGGCPPGQAAGRICCKIQAAQS